MGGSSEVSKSVHAEPGKVHDVLTSGNVTESLHHVPVHKNLPMAAAQIHETLAGKQDKPEEIDTSPYTASVLGVIIAICFLLGLLGVSINQARERRRERKATPLSAVTVGRHQVGRRGSECGSERGTAAGSVVSFPSSERLPGLSSKTLDFDFNHLPNGKSHLEPEVFAAAIKEEMERHRLSKIAAMGVSSISAGTFVRPAGFDVDKLGKGRPEPEPKVYVATMTEELKVPASPLSFGNGTAFNKSSSEQLQLEPENVRATKGRFTIRAI